MSGHPMQKRYNSVHSRIHNHRTCSFARVIAKSELMPSTGIRNHHTCSHSMVVVEYELMPLQSLRHLQRDTNMSKVCSKEGLPMGDCLSATPPERLDE